ncbi:MAG: TonB-dependent receptor [Woeseiaceae bacterium]|nr:TonB-dependent receptor [Woeseiaceae bacterium]
MKDRNRHCAARPSAPEPSHSSPEPAFAMTPLTAAVVAALNPLAAAQAQDDAGLRIEEIVVTATKRELNMQDLGQSITAITNEDIQKQAFQNMEDVMRVLPSVSLANALPGRNSIIMRGLSTGTQEYYTDSQVAVYLDEQPITTISQQPDFRMVDIERIESLPGPQGTLFGSSSQAGTIRYITRKPDPTGYAAEVAAGLSTTRGGEASHELEGWVNIPLLDDRFAVRLVGYTTHDGGWVDNVFGTTLEGSENNAAVVEEDYNEWDNVGGRISARWIASDAWEVTLSHIIHESSTEGNWETDPAVGDYKHVKFFKEIRDDDWYQSSATIRGDLGFAELTATASFFERDIVYEWDNMVYEQWKDAYWGAYYALYNSDYTFGTIFNDQEVTRDAYELRLTSTGDSRLQWMIGGYYEDSFVGWFYGAKNPDYVGTTSWYAAQYYAYYYNYLGYDVQYPLPPTDIGYSETYSNAVTQTAAFGELKYNVTDEWQFTFGARWFEYDRDTTTIYQFPQGLPPFGSFDTGGREDASGVDSDTVLKIGTTYHLDDDIMAFAIFSEGFRLGGHNNRRAANTGFVPQIFESDKVENIELGIKSALAGGALQLNVIAFRVEWEDIQINRSGVDGKWWLRGTLNGGKGENTGVELDMRWQTTPNLYLYGNASFGEPQYAEGNNTTFVDIPDGTPMVWAYKEKLSFGLEYTIPDIFGGYAWLGYNYSYEGPKWNTLSNAIDRDPEGRVPGWSLSNMHAGLATDGGWTYQLTIRNVFDQLAVNSLYNDSSGELFGDPRFNNIRNYARPRTVGFKITKRFE